MEKERGSRWLSSTILHLALLLSLLSLPVHGSDSLALIDSEDPLLHVELIPGYTGTYTGGVVPLESTTISINSDGFRDLERPLKKTGGVTRILILGDSMVFGPGVEIEDTFPKVVERILNMDHNESSYEVFNMGVSGTNAQHHVRRALIKGLRYDPDIVVFALFNNDMMPPYDPEVPFGTWTDHVWRWMERTLLKWDAPWSKKSARWVRAKVETRYMHWAGPRQREFFSDVVEQPMHQFAENITGEQIAGVIFLFPPPFSSYEGLEEDLLRVAEKERLTFLYEDKNAPGRTEDYILHPDDSHPNPQGHAYIADILTMSLRNAGLID